MAVDYSKLTAAADTLISTAGTLLSLVPQGTTTKIPVMGVQSSKPSQNSPGTTIQTSNATYLLSPAIRKVPMIGDQLTRAQSSDNYIITSVRAIAPAGITVYYEVEVTL